MSRHNASPREGKSQQLGIVAVLLTSTLLVVASVRECAAQQKSAAPPPKKSGAPQKKGEATVSQQVQWSVQPDPAPAAKRPLAEKSIAIECKDTEVHQLLFASPDAGLAAVVNKVGKESRLDRYDLLTGKHAGGIELANMQIAQELVAISPDGGRAAHGDNKDRLEVMSATDGKSVAAWRPYDQKTGADGKLMWAAFLDADRIVTANQAGRVDLWKLPQTHPAWTIEKASKSSFVHARHQLGLALSPARRYLAAFNGQGFDLIDPATGEIRGRTAVVKELGNSSAASATAFSPDGKQLAAVVGSIGLAGSLLVRWDMATGEIVDQFRVPIAANFSLQLRPSIRERERQWSVQGPQVTSLAWWGPKHVLLSNEHLLDIERKWFVWHFKLDGAGVQGVSCPDDRHWFAASQKHGGTAMLTALPLPAAEIERAVAVAADTKAAALVRPGSKVGLAVEIDGPPTSAESYREKMREQLTALLASHGLTVDVGEEIKLVVRTKVIEGTETFNIRTRGEKDSVGSFKAKRLLTQIYWADKQGKPLWQDDDKIDPGRIGTSLGPEDPPTSQLNQQWGNAGSVIGRLIPFLLPQKSDGPTLPGDSLLTPDGIKPAPAKNPLPLLDPTGRPDRQAA
jgi:hypothetical protein